MNKAQLNRLDDHELVLRVAAGDVRLEATERGTEQQVADREDARDTRQLLVGLSDDQRPPAPLPLPPMDDVTLRR